MTLILLLLSCATDPTDAAPRARGRPERPDLGDEGDDDVDTGDTADTGAGGDTAESGDTAPLDDGPEGFIGGPCESDDDCDYDGGVCLRDEAGFPRGTCSMGCESTCPDADGHPVTSCIDEGELPAGADDLRGSCLSRCDFGVFPYDGCRPDYGCVQVHRADPDMDDVFSCLPGREDDIGECRAALAARGVPFEPQVRSDEHPAEDETLTCHIEEPVHLGPTLAGVDLRYYYDEESDRVLIDCETAGSILETAEDVGPLGVVELVHVGTYNCRLIAGSDSLSQHGLGRALDVNGFTFESGEVITVYDHWEDGDTTPESWEGQFLYEAVHRWYDDWIWNIILTPEYNEAHDNHFHVDMTEDAHVLNFTDGRAHYLGPPIDGRMD